MTSLILVRVFGNSPEFLLNVQCRNDLCAAVHNPRERERIERARSLKKSRETTLRDRNAANSQ